MNESEVRKRFLLQPEFLAQALAVIWAITVTAITAFALLSNVPSPLTDFFEAIYLFYSISPQGLAIGFAWGFLHGYLQGFLIGWIYKLLVNRKRDEIVLPGLEESLATNSVTILRKGRGNPPYTIVFVANPAIKKFKDMDDDEQLYEADPIIEDRTLFATTVRRSILSFKQNELLGLPEIFNDMRIVAIFDTNRKEIIDEHALVQEQNADEILAPRKKVNEIILEYVKDHVPDFSVSTNLKTQAKNHRNDIDLIYVVSGSKTHIRSAARFCREEIPKKGENWFTLTFRSYKAGKHKLDKKYHTCFTLQPGVVALSALDDRAKTTVHEFAHAFSSRENGLIDDEYMDETLPGKIFRINKKTRTHYKITPETINGLKEERDPETRVPVFQGQDAILKNLEGLKSELIGDTDFLYAVIDRIGQENTEKYGYLILKHADQTQYLITSQTLLDLELQGLPPEVIENTNGQPAIRDMLNQNFFGKVAFNEALNQLIGPGNAQLYREQIYRAAKHKTDPIEKHFTTYKYQDKSETYASDRSRPATERHWTSYVSERFSPLESCTLDRTRPNFRFDRLIFDVLYDRLVTKINRHR